MTSPDELLRRRARDLARPLHADGTGVSREVMRFRLGEERYAVPLGDIRQVVPLGGAARLPGAAWPLVALAPVAGRIVPVVEPRPTAPAGALRVTPPWGVAVASGTTVVCLPADEVTGVVALRDTEVTADAAGDRHARGLTRDGDVLLDVDGLVAAMAVGQRQDGRTGATGPGDDV